MLENLRTKRENFARKEQSIISVRDAGSYNRVLNFVGNEVKKEVRFFQSFVCCSFSVFRSSSENCLFIDLNHTSKQRVHVRELTHQARESCLKRVINYISKGREHRTVFYASLAVRWKVLFCSFIVYSRSSMHSMGCDFYSKKLILVQTNDCKI